MSTVVKQRKIRLPADCMETALQYRKAMKVCEIMVFPEMRGEPAMPVCPRCETTMEREYMAYCDCCGQCLDWSGFKKARVVYPKNWKG